MKFNASTRIIFLTIFVDLLGFGIIIPILPTISSQYFDLKSSGYAGGMLMASYSLLQMIFSPIWGRLSDRIGRRPVLIISLFGSCVAYFIFAISGMLPGAYWILLASRVFAGICGGNITAAQAFIADVTDSKDRTAGMGLVGMAFGLGFALGPVFGGFASWAMGQLNPQSAPQLGPGLLAGCICLVNFLWALARLPESLPPERRGQSSTRRYASPREARAVLRHPAIGPLIIFFFIATFAFSNVEVSFSLFANHIMGPGIVAPHHVAANSPEGQNIITRHVYHYFIFIGLVLAFTQGFLVRRLVKRVHESTLIVAGAGILVIGLIIMPTVRDEYLMLIPCCILALGNGLSNPSILSLISRAAGSGEQGNVLGTNQAAGSLARIVGPGFAGALWSVDPRAPFWGAAVIMCGALWWATVVRRRLLAVASPT